MIETFHDYLYTRSKCVRHRLPLQRTAAHCITLQHTDCNTLHSLLTHLTTTTRLLYAHDYTTCRCHYTLRLPLRLRLLWLLLELRDYVYYGYSSHFST